MYSFVSVVFHSTEYFGGLILLCSSLFLLLNSAPLYTCTSLFMFAHQWICGLLIIFLLLINSCMNKAAPYLCQC